jgi:cyanophycinase-like exopeptidase
MKEVLRLFLWLMPFSLLGQDYTSYLSGSATDTTTKPRGGVCLMGGATEDDNAMKWFLQRAAGGDVLVLRTSGSDGYNAYLYADLGISVNSVETIVCHNASASNDPYVQQRINQAEAIWLAGGDQWTYVSYWRNTPVAQAINQAIRKRNIVIGGTSAGMAVLGGYYFSAQNGTVSSGTALSNPYHQAVTVDSLPFIDHHYLKHTITDTHFDNPNRKGRLLAFLARIKNDYGGVARAIACDEYTAVCIDTNGMAHVFGGHPTYDDNAYFIQANCELTNQMPENCSPGAPLTWNRGGRALKAYQIRGDSTGNKTFNLKDWQSGTGGLWLNWYAVNGNFSEQAGAPLNCNSTAINEVPGPPNIIAYPNPVRTKLTLTGTDLPPHKTAITLQNHLGQNVNFAISPRGAGYVLDLQAVPKGIYTLVIRDRNQRTCTRKIIKY